MSKNASSSKQSKLSRYLKAPIRILIKARDLYMKSMTEYSDRISIGTVMGCPTAQINTLPRSYSVSSSTKTGNGDDDYLRDLIRAASTRGLSNKVQLDVLRRQQAAVRHCSPNTLPRSLSVGIGRIDEDKACDFEADHVKVRSTTRDVFPRSRSYAVTRSTNGAAFF